jgi:hypothetical protein
MYAWMARWLQNKPADVKVAERSFTPESIPNLLVFNGRALPSNAVDVPKLTENWIEAAKKQLATEDTNVFQAALRHSLGFAAETPANGPAAEAGAGKTVLHGTPTVLLANSNPDLERALTKGGVKVSAIAFTKYDADAAAKVHHFETYNRTPASQRVADIVAAVRAHPGAAVVAEGDDALATILAGAIEPISVAVLDVAFDSSSDAAFVEHLYIPGLRRAGDLQTAAAMAAGPIIVHDAGTSFVVKGVDSRAEKATPSEIIALVSKPRAPRTR